MDLKNTNIRALSWKEPFGSLMLHGKIETRTWYTKYRGLVLICTSKKSYNDKELFSISGWDTYHKIYDLVKENTGKAVAVGNLVECRGMNLGDGEKCFVNFNSSLFCHIYEDVRAIEPFEWKGSQGWRTLTEEQKNLIKFI